MIQKSKSSVFFGLLLYGMNALAGSPVTKVQVGSRDLLADRNGMTAYTFDPDKTTESTCYGSCAKNWPPILAASTDQIQPPLGLTTRKDGKKQITFNGHPIYLFAGDFKTGDIKGDGLAGVWHVIPQ